MSLRSDYQKTLDRWPDWDPKLVVCKATSGVGWEGKYVGPHGGRHSLYAFTRRGVVRAFRGELAEWTRKRRRAAGRKRSARTIDVRSEL